MTSPEQITRMKHVDGSFTVEGWRKNGSVLCPNCGSELVLWEDVEEYETYTGKVTGWGPGTAECCSLVLICSWDRDFVLNLEASHD